MSKMKMRSREKRIRSELEVRMENIVEDARSFLEIGTPFELAVTLSKYSLKTVNRTEIFASIEAAVTSFPSSFSNPLEFWIHESLLRGWTSEAEARGRKLAFEDRIFLGCVAQHAISDWAMTGLRRKKAIPAFFPKPLP